MIPVLEIKEAARKFAVPPSTIERDYAQNWLLAYLHPLPMALKGGTGIRKVFFEGYRFSDDLDFTLFEPYDARQLEDALHRALDQVREASGIPFRDTVEMLETRSGVRATVRFQIIPMSATIPIRIDLDITDPENEDILLPVVERPVFHPYSDHLKATVRSYQCEEIMAEKIRALFERSRSRDLYDVWMLSRQIGKDAVAPILVQKCARKSVTISPEHLASRKETFRRAWENSLRHQLRDLPEFDTVFNAVLNEVREYA